MIFVIRYRSMGRENKQKITQQKYKTLFFLKRQNPKKKVITMMLTGMTIEMNVEDDGKDDDDDYYTITLMNFA